MKSLKRLKQHWMAGPLAGLLSATMVLPFLLAWLLTAPRPAQAQTLNRQPTWAVVNFVNNSGYGGNEVGIEASDGFVVELGKSNRYDVLPRSQTLATIRDLGLTEPLDTIGLQKLARSLEADAVATGEVGSVTFSKSPRRATVTIILRVVDRASGELINGAIAQGTSNARAVASNDDDALVNQAIENADFDAVRQISGFNLPRATVLIHRDPQTVTLNKGTQDGLYNGLRMLVSRNGAEVGRIQVSGAGPDESEASVTDQGIGITTDDIATAIYQLPAYSTVAGAVVVRGNTQRTGDPTATGGTHNFITGPLGIIAAAAVGIFLVGQAHTGNSGSSFGARLGGGTATLDFNSTSNIEPPADNPTNLATFVPAAIRIDFNNGNIPTGGVANQVVEYHIFREPGPIILKEPFLFQPPTQINADFNEIPLIVQQPAATEAVDTIEDVGPILAHIPNPLDNTALVIGQFYSGTGVANSPELPIPGTGLQIGDRVRYRIQAVFSLAEVNLTGTTGTGTTGTGTTGTGTTGTGTTGTGTTGTGTTGTGTTTTTTTVYSLSEPIYTNSVTFLQPVLLRNSTPDTTSTGASSFPTGTANPDTDPFGLSTGPNNVTVLLRSVFVNPSAGAVLQYDIEFSSDVNFAPSKTFVARTVTPPTGGTELDPRNGPAFEFANLDLTSGAALSALGTNPGVVYVRAGVRDLRGGDFVYSSIDPSPLTTRVLPGPLTPGGATAAAIAKARAHAATLATAATTAGHGRTAAGINSLASNAKGAVRPALVPSVQVHPEGVTFQQRVPPRNTAPIRPGR